MLRGILFVLLGIANLVSLLLAATTGALLGQRVPLLNGTALEGRGLEQWAFALLFAALGGLHCLLPLQSVAAVRNSNRMLLWLLWWCLALVLTSTEATTALAQPGLKGLSLWHAIAMLVMLAAIGSAPAAIVSARPRDKVVSRVSENETVDDGSAPIATPPASAEALFRLIAFRNRSDFPGVVLRPDGRLRTSAKALAEVIGCSRTTAWRNLRALVEFECVELRSDRHGTTVTLLDHPLWRKPGGLTGSKPLQRQLGTGATQLETPPNHGKTGTGINLKQRIGTDFGAEKRKQSKGSIPKVDRLTLGDPTKPRRPGSATPELAEITKIEAETARNIHETSRVQRETRVGPTDPQERGIDAGSRSNTRFQTRSRASPDKHVAPTHDTDSTEAESAEWAFNPDLRIRLPFDFGELGRGRRAEAARQVAVALVANMVASLQRGSSGRVHYSRDRNRYCRGRYQPPWLTLGAVRRAVDGLSLSGLIIEERAQASPRQKRRSTICPTPLLIERLVDPRSCYIFFEPTELIQLRDIEKKPKDYVDDADTIAMRNNVREHNAMLARITVDLEDKRVEWMAPDLLRFAGVIYCFRITYRRIFNTDFRTGGRWYADIQNMPKLLRPALTIDGERTVEYDYRACHFRLLSALAKLPLETSQVTDPFTLPGQDRQVIKRAFNIYLNAASDQSAVLALSGELQDQGISDPHHMARRALDVITKTFPQFANYWGKGFGLKLQRHDAEICTTVQRRMRERNIPVISIHDSFIASARYANTLEQIAIEVFEEHCDTLRLI